MNIALEAKLRNTKKKSDLNQLRESLYIPAVIYKSGEKGINISILEADFNKAYRQSIGEIAFFDIDVDGKKVKTIIKEKQVHPVSRKVMHIDFLEVVENNKLTLEIPLKFHGEPLGIKQGGKLEILVRKIVITCLPKDIPDEIKIDLSPLNVGDLIHFQDLKLENIFAKLPGNTVLAQVKGVKTVS